MSDEYGLIHSGSMFERRDCSIMSIRWPTGNSCVERRALEFHAWLNEQKIEIVYTDGFYSLWVFNTKDCPQIKEWLFWRGNVHGDTSENTHHTHVEALLAAEATQLAAN